MILLKYVLASAVLFAPEALLPGLAADPPNVPSVSATAPPDKNQYNLFHPAPQDQLRDINALYENPWTVDAGYLQVETYAFQYTRDQDTVGGNTIRRESWMFGPMSIKLGVLNNLDAEVILLPYTKVRYDTGNAGGVTTQSGFGDVVPRVKFNLWGNDGKPTALSVVPFVKVPANQDHLGNHSVEGGVIWPFAVLLPRGWCMVLSPEVDYRRDLFSRGYHPEAANTIYFCHPIAGTLSGYADFLSRVSTERSVPWVGIADFGLSYVWAHRVEIDLGLSVGVTRSADDLNPYLGFTFRF